MPGEGELVEAAKPASMPAASPTVRRPEARRAVSFFVQAALRDLQVEVDAGAEVRFALDSRNGRRVDAGPALYDYRPLYRAYVEARLPLIERLPDFAAAVNALADDPAVLGAARDNGGGASDEQALRDTILVPLLIGVAEGSGGFAFDDSVFDGIWERMLSSVALTRRSFTAFAPLIGVRAPDGTLDLGQGVKARRFQPLELADDWPECQGLLPDGFALVRDRQIGLELDLALPRGADTEEPDAARRFARAVMALRLVHGGPVSAGACLFQRVDWAPRAVRALPASIATTLPGDPTRIDPGALTLVRALVDRIADAEMHGGAVAVALSRWSTASGALVAAERATGMVAAVEPLLIADGGGPYALALRAAALLGASAGERDQIAGAVRAALRLTRPDAPLSDVDRLALAVGDVARAVIVAALDQGDDGLRLAETLDGVLLGMRPRPQVVTGLRRTA